LMAVDAAEAFGATSTLTLPVPARLSVTPGIAPVTVFEALEMLMPFTESEALRPWAPAVNPKLPAVEETLKPPALPLVLLTRANREPDASVTILAVTPAPELLIAFSRSVSVLTPLPVVMVVAVPLAGVMVMVSAGRSVVALATALEAKEAVLARLVTTTALSPAVLPVAADAVSTPLFDEFAVKPVREPVRLLRDFISLSRFVAAVSIVFRSLV
jgi:hypothetical protein